MSEALENKAFKDKLATGSKTLNKPVEPEQTKEFLRQSLKPEIDLYNFILDLMQQRAKSDLK